MGWQPTTGFSGYGNWIGYNEGMMLYLLGLGTATNPVARFRVELLDQRIYLGHLLWSVLHPVSSFVWARILPLLD